MKLSTFVKAAGLAALFAAGAASAAPVNLITNGDFESYSDINVPNGGYAVVFHGSGQITGWDVGANSVDLIQNAYNSINTTSVDMLGTPGPGQISQNFNFAANTTYTLSFDLTHNPYASQGALVQVDFFGQSHVVDGMSPLHTETFTFTTGATGGVSTLAFSSVGGDGYSGGVIDNVSVSAPVPEPETYAMLVAGLGLLAFVSRRKGKQA
jgi:choice-of-anchor C domain-containing protein